MYGGHMSGGVAGAVVGCSSMQALLRFWWCLQSPAALCPRAIDHLRLGVRGVELVSGVAAGEWSEQERDGVVHIFARRRRWRHGWRSERRCRIRAGQEIAGRRAARCCGRDEAVLC
jgi:hypothetical protein